MENKRKADALTSKVRPLMLFQGAFSFLSFLVRWASLGELTSATGSQTYGIALNAKFVKNNLLFTVKYPIEDFAIGCIYFRPVKINIDVGNGVATMTEGSGYRFFGDVKGCSYGRPRMTRPIGRQRREG